MYLRDFRHATYRNHRRRRGILQRVAVVAKRHFCRYTTLHLALRHADAALARSPNLARAYAVPEIAAACVWIASKFDHSTVPLQDFAYATAPVELLQNVQACERSVLTSIEYRVACSTAGEIVQELAAVCAVGIEEQVVSCRAGSVLELF